MDPRFQPNNTHFDHPEDFAKTDPHLKRLHQSPYVYHSPMIAQLPKDEPGILTLGGGRQIGKSTLLKQWMESLLSQGITPQSLCFISCELISDNQTMYNILLQQLSEMPKDKLRYLILDEITYVPGWDKTIKYLADTGAFEDVLVILTGSDLVLMQDARMRFPGRRGKLAQADYHYYPLSFKEFLELKNKLPEHVDESDPDYAGLIQDLYKEFDNYLMHGGFLPAINDYATSNTIHPATLTTYSDWIRGDVLKRGKQETYLTEVLEAIIKHYTKQVSWDNLVKELSIDHTQTVSDYISLLSSMDAVFVQSALIEDKLKAAPKKRKKLMFCDPFIYHALEQWIEPKQDPFAQSIQGLFSNSQLYAAVVEACVTTHFRRYYPTYYIKAEGEVDVAYVDDKKFWPIEVKWTNQLRPKDLKQVAKYKNGKVLAKVKQRSEVNGIPIIPLPLCLLEL